MPHRRRRVVEMYLAGEKTASITAETGVKRATIYSILRSEGIEPNRSARAGRTLTDAEALRIALAQADHLRRDLDAANALIAELQDEVSRLHAESHQHHQAILDAVRRIDQRIAPLVTSYP